MWYAFIFRTYFFSKRCDKINYSRVHVGLAVGACYSLISRQAVIRRFRISRFSFLFCRRRVYAVLQLCGFGAVAILAANFVLSPLPPPHQSKWLLLLTVLSSARLVSERDRVQVQVAAALQVSEVDVGLQQCYISRAPCRAGNGCLCMPCVPLSI